MGHIHITAPLGTSFTDEALGAELTTRAQSGFERTKSTTLSWCYLRISIERVLGEKSHLIKVHTFLDQNIP
jgi:hypothetical protein